MRKKYSVSSWHVTETVNQRERNQGKLKNGFYFTMD